MQISIIEKLLIGGTSGLLGFWIAHKRFISQRWWDKQFDLFVESIDILKQIENCLAVYLWAIESNKTIDNSEKLEKAYLDFEEGLSLLHGLQSKLLMTGLDEMHLELMVLGSALQAVHPHYLTSEPQEDKQEIIDLIKQSISMTCGCSMQLAYLGKEKLGFQSPFLSKMKKLRNQLTIVFTLLLWP